MFEGYRYLPNYYIKSLKDRHTANYKTGKEARKFPFDGPGNYQNNSQATRGPGYCQLQGWKGHLGGIKAELISNGDFLIHYIIFLKIPDRYQNIILDIGGPGCCQSSVKKSGWCLMLLSNATKKSN